MLFIEISTKPDNLDKAYLTLHVFEYCPHKETEH